MTDRDGKSPRLPKRFSWEGENGTPSSYVADGSRAARSSMGEASTDAHHSPARRDAAKDDRSGRIPGLNRGSHKGRYRTGGGFLLQDAVASGSAEDASGHRRKPSRRLLQSIRKSSSRKEKKTQPANDGLGISSEPGPEPRSPTSTGEELPTSKDGASTDEPSTPHDEDAERAPLDLESAQIVDMALRISQSRRAASQRVVSQQAPPRLTPLPDTSGASSLKQHLQQQRKVARNGSPRRNASAVRNALDSFDVSAEDGSYRYHISRSTLARVQKAKEYMEIMAQYRRLLGHLPALRAAGGHESGSQGDGAGRQYNPLQYIRNRKVRARERQPLDGEAQGFTDVMQVTNWIDEVANWSNTDGQALDGDHPPPTFASAERHKNDVPSASEGSKAAAKLARRRIDWLVEPADLIADAYWLEQGNNKSLIQDRDWNWLYPRLSDASLRPSPQIEERLNPLSRPSTRDYNEVAGSGSVDSKARLEVEPHRSPKEHRLNVRGLHRRHRSSQSHHELLRPRRGSVSDLSDSDWEARDQRTRSGTITRAGKDILEKQMMEMIAREERESALRSSRSETSPPKTTSEQTDPPSNPPSRIHSRTGSMADISESEDKGSQQLRPTASRRSTRLRVDIPGKSRQSLDADTAPNGPGRPPSRDSLPDASPTPSRGASPPRNPFSKVKHYFGDRKDRNAYIDERIREIDVNADLHRWSMDPFTSQPERKATSPERLLSASPTRRPSRRASPDGRGHLRVPSSRNKDDDAATRGIFKAPARIDNVFRTGVSKIGDMIWRKESDATDPGGASEGTATDESEAGLGRGRAESREEGVKRSYLDQMPAFQTPERLASRHLEGSERGSERRGSLQSGPSEGRPRALSGLTPETQPRSVPGVEVEKEERESEDERGSRPPRPMLPPSLGARHFSQRTDKSAEGDHVPVSRREIARLRALLLSSGVMAMEISRRAKEPRALSPMCPGPPQETNLPWGEIANLAPGTKIQPIASPLESYPLAAGALEGSIMSSSKDWQEKAEHFTSDTAPNLHAQLDKLRIKLAVDLSSTIREASDEADETSREATQTQRLRVKRVVDVIEKMLRRRRRRFRWVRRAGWLGLEWVLVGFMWYVWFVVMLLRVVMGVGRGAVAAVRWLLWL